MESDLVDSDGERSPDRAADGGGMDDSDLDGAASRDDDDPGDPDRRLDHTFRGSRAREQAGGAAAAVAAAFSAASRNDSDRVAALLSAGLLSADDRGEDGTTLLHVAASHGFERLMQLLVRGHDADVDAADLRGNTPCHAAAEAGHTQAVRLLCKLGADDGLMNVDGEGCYDLVQAGPIRGLRARVAM